MLFVLNLVIRAKVSGNVLFTQAGKELFTIYGAIRDQEFYDYAIDQLSYQNICLSTMTLKTPLFKNLFSHLRLSFSIADRTKSSSK